MLDVKTMPNTPVTMSSNLKAIDLVRLDRLERKVGDLTGELKILTNNVEPLLRNVNISQDLLRDCAVILSSIMNLFHPNNNKTDKMAYQKCISRDIRDLLTRIKSIGLVNTEIIVPFDYTDHILDYENNPSAKLVLKLASDIEVLYATIRKDIAKELRSIFKPHLLEAYNDFRMARRITLDISKDKRIMSGFLHILSIMNALEMKIQLREIPKTNATDNVFNTIKNILDVSHNWYRSIDGVQKLLNVTNSPIN